MKKVDASGYHYSADGVAVAITADSSPVYFANSGVGTILNPGAWFYTGKKTDKATGLPGWTWQDWAKWYDLRKAKYGVDKANRDFADAWQRGLASDEGGSISDSESGAGVLWNSVPIDAKYDDNFLAWLKGKDYLYNVIFKGVLGTSAESVNKTVEVGKEIGSGVAGIGSGIGKSLKVVGYVIPVLLGIAAIGIVWYGFKKVKTA